jgi:hypothetical protein
MEFKTDIILSYISKLGGTITALSMKEVIKNEEITIFVTVDSKQSRPTVLMLRRLNAHFDSVQQMGLDITKVKLKGVSNLWNFQIIAKLVVGPCQEVDVDLDTLATIDFQHAPRSAMNLAPQLAHLDAAFDKAIVIQNMLSGLWDTPHANMLLVPNQATSDDISPLCPGGSDCQESPLSFRLKENRETHAIRIHPYTRSQQCWTRPSQTPKTCSLRPQVYNPLYQRAM